MQHHNPFPRFSLFADVIQASGYVVRGLHAILQSTPKTKRKQHTIHKVLMFFGFVHGIEGSGQIRFTAWVIWIISRFLPMRYAVYFDTTVCQGTNFATCPRASAGNCVLAYMVSITSCDSHWALLFSTMYLYSLEGENELVTYDDNLLQVSLLPHSRV